MTALLDSQSNQSSPSDVVDPSHCTSVHFSNESRLAGVVWLTVQSLVSKLLQMTVLIPLTWLLEPKELGLIGLVTAILAFCGLIQQCGIREVLIQRQSEFNQWATAAFWMSACAGTLGAVIICLSSPIASFVWNKPHLPGLLLVIAITVPLQALVTVPEARLYTRLRFRAMAVTGIVIGLLQAGLTLVMAWLGMAAYSFVLPVAVAAGLRLTCFWALAGCRMHWLPEFYRWRLLVTDSSVIFLTNLSYIVVSQGDYLVLGKMISDESLGHYFLAFNLAMAPLHLFATNLNSVLFPSLSLMSGNTHRQAQVCLRVSRILALVVMPLSFVQAIAVEPMVKLLFDSTWHAIIPLAQILSLGMALRCIGWPSASLMQAAGRFRTRLVLAVTWAALLLFGVGLGAWIGQVLAATVAVALVYTVVGPVTLYVALRPHGMTLRQLSIQCGRPLMAAFAVSLPAWTIGRILMDYSPAVQLASILGTAIVLYLPLIRFADSESTAELLRRLTPQFLLRFHYCRS